MSAEVFLLFVFAFGFGALAIAAWGLAIALVATKAMIAGDDVKQAITPLLEEW